jgi:hypothetical protein
MTLRPDRKSTRGAILVALLACALLWAADARAAPRFVGVNADGPAIASPARVGAEVRAMARAGARAVRWTVNWPELQPYPSWAEVPADRRAQFEDVGGIPTDFRSMDRIVAATARADVRLLPVILSAPPWAAENPFVPISPPLDANAFGRFAATLAARYGTRGSFWRSRPVRERRPIRDWQIWNEPAGWGGFNTFTTFWTSNRDALVVYGSLLTAARREMRAVDPGSRIVLGGLFGRSWIALQQLYAAGAGPAFDAVAIHPFAIRPADVVRVLVKVRRVMARHGDARKPLEVTEIAWPSALGRVQSPSQFAVTPRQQAKRLTKVYTLLARKRQRLRLRTAYWYTWMTSDASSTVSFDYAGLIARDSKGRLRRKPAFFAFRKVARRLNGPRR